MKKIYILLTYSVFLCSCGNIGWMDAITQSKYELNNTAYKQLGFLNGTEGFNTITFEKDNLIIQTILNATNALNEKNLDIILMEQ